MEFIRSFQSEAPLKRGVVSAQDASLQERVLAQVGAAALKVPNWGPRVGNVFLSLFKQGK